MCIQFMTNLWRIFKYRIIWIYFLYKKILETNQDHNKQQKLESHFYRDS